MNTHQPVGTAGSPAMNGMNGEDKDHRRSESTYGHPHHHDAISTSHHTPPTSHPVNGHHPRAGVPTNMPPNAFPVPDSVYYASGGTLQPGKYMPYEMRKAGEHRKIANPAPLGLSAFALTTFVLSLVNLRTRGVATPNIAVPLAFGYGGLVQLLAGMWEMAIGNTFGATALSSYGGFWISYAILLTPNWGILNTETGPYAANPTDAYSAVGFFLTGWFIFTFIMLLCTVKSTVAFFSLFFTLDLAFLMLACENFALSMGMASTARGLAIAGGSFGILSAFLAWYCALAGIQDKSNSFFQVPVVHLPWSDTGKEKRDKKNALEAV